MGNSTTERLESCPYARFLLIDPPPLAELGSRYANVPACFGPAGMAKDGKLVIHSHSDQSRPLVAVEPGWRAMESITMVPRPLISFAASGEIAPPFAFMVTDVCLYSQGADGSLEQSDILFLRRSRRRSRLPRVQGGSRERAEA